MNGAFHQEEKTAISPGDVVVSLMGHDRGSLLLVVEQSAAFLLVADGKRRPLARPKRKNRRHLALCQKAPFSQTPPTDRALRRALRALKEPPEQPT